MLLEQEDINPKTINKNCTKPQSIVAWNRQERVVQMLLGQFDVDPNTDDEDGQPPLWIAPATGTRELWNHYWSGMTSTRTPRTNVVQATLESHLYGTCRKVKDAVERLDVNLNVVSQSGETPLFLATHKVSEGEVNILLERLNVHPNSGVEDGNKPVFGATCEDYEGVVQVPPFRNDTNPNTANIYGRTALCKAARTGHEGVVKMLLERFVSILILLSRMAKLWYSGHPISGIKGLSRVRCSCTDCE